MTMDQKKHQWTAAPRAHDTPVNSQTEL